MYCNPAMDSKTAVIGVGNLLMRDDGVGVHVVRAVEKRGVPEGVRCIDGGTTSFEALDAAGDCEHVIVVDAVQAGRRPGTIYRMSLEEWRAARGISLHDVCLLDAISIAETVEGRKLSVSIIGIEPKEISLGLDLSPAVRERVGDLINCVLDEIERIGTS